MLSYKSISSFLVQAKLKSLDQNMETPPSQDLALEYNPFPMPNSREDQ